MTDQHRRPAAPARGACARHAGQTVWRFAKPLGAFAVSALLLGGCSYWPGSGNNGAFYTNVTRPVAVLDQEAAAVRTGEACSTGILGLVASGNSSVNSAKTKAGITKISTVEERFTHYLLGAYTKYCTIVSGT